MIDSKDSASIPSLDVDSNAETMKAEENSENNPTSQNTEGQTVNEKASNALTPRKNVDTTDDVNKLNQTDATEDKMDTEEQNPTPKQESEGKNDEKSSATGKVH